MLVMLFIGKRHVSELTTYRELEEPERHVAIVTLDLDEDGPELTELTQDLCLKGDVVLALRQAVVM
jgi:hypothetical protein